MTRAAARKKPQELIPVVNDVFPREIPHTDVQLFDLIKTSGHSNGERVFTVMSKGRGTVLSHGSLDIPYVVTLVSRPSSEERKAFLTPQQMDQIISRGYNYICRVGSDPEIFVENEEGKVVPAFEFLKDKEQVGVEDPYWDGFQAEFSTTPSHCIAYLADSTQRALERLHEQVRTVGKGKWKLSDRSVVDVDEGLLHTIHPKYAQFGCTPSLNAYGDNPPMLDGRYVPFRMAGGHIHIGARMKGIDADHMVKQMDKLAGIMSVALFRGMEDPRRRELYGRAGEYRLPPHGLEYRVLSNAWLCHPAVMHFITHATRISAALGMWGFTPTDITDDEARECLNTGNADMAWALVQRNKEVFDKIMRSVCGSWEGATPIRDMFYKALERGIKDFLPAKTLEDRWLFGKWALHSGSNNASVSNSYSAIKATGKLG